MTDDLQTAKEPPEVLGVDKTIPSVARVYDAVLGGKNNFAPDRAVADQLLAIDPDAFTMPRDNRAWLARVVRFLAAHRGIDQFLDCGSGLPTTQNTHEVLAGINKDGRVLYVDNDPAVIAYGRALLSSEMSEIIDADVSRPAELLARPDVQSFFDWSRPIGLLQIGVLHHIMGDAVYRVMQTYLDAMPPGSHVAISHFYNPGDDSPLAERAAATEAILLGGDLQSGEFRSRDEIERLFCGWPLIEPELAFLSEWWPEGPPTGPMTLPQQVMLGGVAESPTPARGQS